MSANKTNKLDDLSADEIAKLFPIIMDKPNPDWGNLFEVEKKRIIDIIGERAIRIEHIGSTAIPNIYAKPTIDILVEIVNDDTIKGEIIALMQAKNYHFILRKDRLPPFISFLKGYTSEGFKGQVYHIYMAEKEHIALWDRLYFKRYLIENKEVAQEYEKLKMKLATIFKYDREAYTDGKTEFVTRITKIAKQRYKSES
ncbi:GrpB family protein [Flavobacteriaceae bacterium MHTCC 0001]